MTKRENYFVKNSKVIMLNSKPESKKMQKKILVIEKKNLLLISWYAVFLYLHSLP